MKKLFSLACICVLIHNAVNAQSKHLKIKPATLNIGLETALPVGLISHTNSFGLGMSMKTVTPVTSFAAATVSGGITRYFSNVVIDGWPKTTLAFLSFPVKGGMNFYTRKGLYAEPQVGYSIMAKSGFASNGAFCWTMNFGATVNRHLDISFHYESMLAYSASFSNTGFRFAYVF
jgi:hypothetical protein